jgi:AcrR family transcriptional regulator
MVGDKAALVIAHPGHELCVFGWVETVSPKVFILTDGSGRSGIPRLASTTKILAQTGASVGSIYGRFTDQNVYEAILNHNYKIFEQLIEELAEALVGEEIKYVAGDAAEGYNPIHDTCRLVIDGAVDLARRRSGRQITNTDFLLYAPHDNHPHELRPAAMWLTLDDVLLERKLEVARAYPELKPDIDAMLERQTLETLQRFPELSADFDDMVTRTMGTDAYRTECLRLVTTSTAGNGPSGEIPFYERYGQLLVSEGTYDRAISHRDHIVPLGEAIRQFVN